MPCLDRPTLDRQLDELEAGLPALIAETEPECVMDAFAGIADEILLRASAADCRHVDATINCILHKARLVPGNENEACYDR